MPYRFYCLLPFALYVFSSVGVFAQTGVATDSGVPAPTLRVTARSVVVDVVVTDEMGRPVRGLNRRDFSVAEDGEPQKVLSFERHDMDARPFASQLKLPANTFSNLAAQQERGPLYLLVYDMGASNMDDQIFARHQLVKFLASKPAGTRFAVMVISDGLHLIQGFTDDRDLVLKALDLYGKTPHVPMIFLYAANYGMSYPWALRRIAEYLDGLPGRKNVIWVSARFAFGYGEAANREFAFLAGHQIAIYPVFDAGLTHGYDYIAEDAARLTGGRYFASSNDLEDLLRQATDDGASYYTLSYSPSNTVYKGNLRHIEVKLAKKGYQLSYRRQYYADDEGSLEDSPDDHPLFGKKRPTNIPPPDTLFTYVRHGMPMSHEVIFTAHARAVGSPKLATAEQMANLSDEPAYFRKRKKNRPLKPLPPVPLQSYVLDYSVPSRQFRLQPGMKNAEQDTLEFAAAAYNADGYLLNGTIDHATSTTKGKTSFYQARQSFEAPAGATSIAVAVRDVATGRIGNLEIALPLAPEPQEQVRQP